MLEVAIAESVPIRFQTAQMRGSHPVADPIHPTAVRNLARTGMFRCILHGQIARLDW